MNNIKIILSLLFIVFYSGVESLKADGFLIREAKIEHNGQQRPCLVVTVDPEVNDLASEWSKFWRSEHRVRLRGRRGNLTAENISVSALGERSFDLHTLMYRESNQTRMYVFAAYGYDIYFGDRGQESDFEWLKKQLDKFLREYLTTFYNSQIRDLERTLSRSQRDLGRLTSNIERSARNLERNKKEIEKLTKENAKLEKDLRDNRQEASTLEQQIAERNRSLQQINRKRDSIKK